MGVCISRGPGGCAQWVRIEVNGRTTTKGWLAVLGQTPSFCMLSAELHPPKKSSVRYSCCDIVKLPYMPTSFGDHHFPAWLCFQNSSLQHVHLPVCVLPTWADSVPPLAFSLSSLTVHLLGPAGTGSTCRLPRAPGWEREEA